MKSKIIKGLAIACVIIALLFQVYAIEDYSIYESLTLNVLTKAQFEILPKGQNAKAKTLEAELFLLPKENKYQQVLEQQTFSLPTGKNAITDNKIIFQWNDVLPSNMEISLFSKIKTKRRFPNVDAKIRFPITITNPEIRQYTTFQRYININDQIREKAQELAANETDLFVVVFKVAEWVKNNVNYSLETSTAKVIQSSTWVFEHRIGVCDEITNLFVSMLRSLGIPARFVAGIAYSNIQQNWGPHGWAEVYFPNYGWVPFDVTYEQLGWIDPTHVKFLDSLDSVSPSLIVRGSFANAEASAGEVNFNVSVANYGKVSKSLTSMKLEIPFKEVGPGSYVPIRVILKNKQPYYLPVLVKVTKAPELLERNVKSILLKPFQTKSVFWIVKIPEEANESYQYMTTTEVGDSFSNIYSDTISFSLGKERYSLKVAKDYVAEIMQQEENSYLDNFIVDCNPERGFYFDYENATLVCNVKNIGYHVLRNIGVCVEQDCRTVSILEPKTYKTLTFENLPLRKELTIKANVENKTLLNTLSIISFSDPNLRMISISYPEEFPYKSKVDLQMTLKSDTPVDKIKLYVNKKFLGIMQGLEDMQKRTVTIDAKYLYTLNKKANITLVYLDRNGREYSTNRIISVNIVNVPWYAKLFAYLKELF